MRVPGLCGLIALAVCSSTAAAGEPLPAGGRVATAEAGTVASGAITCTSRWTAGEGSEISLDGVVPPAALTREYRVECRAAARPADGHLVTISVERLEGPPWRGHVEVAGGGDRLRWDEGSFGVPRPLVSRPSVTRLDPPPGLAAAALARPRALDRPSVGTGLRASATRAGPRAHGARWFPPVGAEEARLSWDHTVVFDVVAGQEGGAYRFRIVETVTPL